jgi:glycosyltransferase involved in cell wall biosynthesis
MTEVTSGSSTPPEDFRIDIAVCTRDRLGQLRRTVEALREGIGDRPDVNLLLLDNGSRDGTTDYLARMAEADPRVRPVSVPGAGLYNARTVAIEMSDADLLVFCDDDIRPRPDFLGRLEDLFLDPSVGVVGAAIEAARDTPLPEWFVPRFKNYIPILPVSGAQQECRYPCFPPGAFLALRRAPCLAYYLSPERRSVGLGYGGASGLAGEDIDLSDIYARAGYRILRDAGLVVAHHFDPTRLTEGWITERFHREGRLRVLLARLRSGFGLDARILAMLLSWPFLWALVRLTGGAGGPWRILARAYLMKAAGAWRELVSGTRPPRFTYPARIRE